MHNPIKNLQHESTVQARSIYRVQCGFMIIIICFVSRDIGVIDIGIEIVEVVIETAVDGR